MLIYFLKSCDYYPFLSPANYLGNWKCLAVLKGDGTQVDSDRNQSAAQQQQEQGTRGQGQANNVRYFKVSAVQSPQHVPWH